MISKLILINIILINFLVVISALVPKLILLSLDGFRSDYLHSELTPTMYQLSENGIKTRMMKSCYVTKTFPNHWSIVTGLYEENHGIINNKMYDPQLDSYFQPSNLEEKWWDDNEVAHPIWSLNENFDKDRISASSMWPGCPVNFKNGKHPKYIEKFSKNITFEVRMDKVIEWLTKDNEPANFVSIYIDEPDESSHHYGPFSPEVRKKIRNLDDAVKHLLEKLKEVNLLDVTNIIILSDHGMSEIRQDRVVNLTEHFITNDFIVSGVSPNLNLFFKDKKIMDKQYEELKKASSNLPFSVYKKGEVPSEYHFNKHRRIGELVIEADDGYEVITPNFKNIHRNLFSDKVKSQTNNLDVSSLDKKEMNIIEKFEDFLDRKNKTELRFWGQHGYNNSISNMRPLFLASGPAFKKGYVHRTPFENIDVYSLMCSVLHLNLDSKLESTDRYCKMDGQPNRVKKMLKPIKYDGDLDDNSSEKSLNSKDDSWFKLKGFIYIIAGCVSIGLGGLCIYILFERRYKSQQEKKALQH